MPFRSMRVLPATNYDFTPLGLSSSQTIVLAQRIGLGPFTECTLGYRIHYLATPPVGASIELRALAEAFDPDDPAGVLTQAGPPIASVVISNTQGRQFDYYSLDVTVSFGQMIRLHLIGTRGANPGVFGATISLDLACKFEVGATVVVAPRTYAGYGGFVR